MLTRRHAVLGAAAALLPASFAARAQGSDKPLKLIVPYPPGGSSDTIARLISQPLSEALKQTVVIENRAGANGNLGADAVAKAAPDGNTLLLCDVGALAISASVYTKLAFDPARDLRGATMLAYSPHLLVVHPSVPANNLQQLVALSKKQPLNFAVTALGSAPHLAGIAVERATGASWQYIPYKGGSQAIQDTIGGQAQVLMNGMLATWPHVQAGRLKLLGVSKRTRMALIPDVPTIAEMGVKDFESGTWQGVLAPAGTPAPRLQQLNAELVRIIRSPDVRSKLLAQGAEVSTTALPEFTAFFDTERKRWATVVAQAHVRLD